jgi:hypothetical protein
MTTLTNDWRLAYIDAELDGLLNGRISRGYVQQTLLAFRPDPCAPLQWAELPDWIAMILDRLTSGKVRRVEATSLLVQALNAG